MKKLKRNAAAYQLAIETTDSLKSVRTKFISDILALLEEQGAMPIGEVTIIDVNGQGHIFNGIARFTANDTATLAVLDEYGDIVESGEIFFSNYSNNLPIVEAVMNSLTKGRGFAVLR